MCPCTSMSTEYQNCQSVNLLPRVTNYVANLDPKIRINVLAFTRVFFFNTFKPGMHYIKTLERKTNREIT